ncbi:MAG: VIT1/CCC1 transporter family protein [Elusimicrobia bacterium]|jgi:VIT1/CCC1 family predicted Fe2+/Mn2+ transporter|nr:VIT1/CCC1 transporter family protein [Elusimicrobiota bacterium]MBK9695296.1 VIT1/CCC1 transporter family protein [Elusimicrobiota bacterium]MBP8004989.1 VIT1/CCC1 transporter family protein [Elusimicrobiota bacterium]
MVFDPEKVVRAHGEDLVLDELFDLRLYERLRDLSTGSLAAMLGKLVAVEVQHHAFWQDFFGVRRDRLDWGRRLKLGTLALGCRFAGPASIHLVLEGIEIYGIRKYLRLWDAYKDTPFGEALQGILRDEFEHEDEIVSAYTARKLNPERVRGIFLGFNDGLVEILGAVSGFYAALRAPGAVVGASVAVAVAGALSMAAGAYAATSSEREIRFVQKGKARFLGKDHTAEDPGSAGAAGAIVGVSYFVGATVPVLPVLLGAKGPAVSIAAGAVAAIVVSSVLAFLSGMAVRRRIALNLFIIALSVTVTGAIGALVRRVFGLGL